MTWFLFAFICLFAWGFADLFYKKGSHEDDNYSHLKIAVWVGTVMGIGSLVLLPFAESSMSPGTFFSNILKYSPASFCYIISMVIGYAGLRYLELSIISPVQNASGALSAICILLWFLFTGKISGISEELSSLDIAGALLIAGGMIFLAVVQHRLSVEESPEKRRDKKYSNGAAALIFPLLYCVFDTMGTAADGIILDEETGLGLGEIDVIILYGFTFLTAGIVAWIFIFAKTKKPYNPFKRKELPKATAAVCEELGQVFYVYAMASRPVLAAPMVASYCIVSVILSAVFLKEKLKISQYLCISAVITGIVMLGISEGLS